VKRTQEQKNQNLTYQHPAVFKAFSGAKVLGEENEKV